MYPKAVFRMGHELLDANLLQILSVTRFHVLGSQRALEESRRCLAESQRKILMSQRIIATSDALIKTLQSNLESSEDQEPAHRL